MAGQVKGPFAWLQADVILGNHLALGAAFTLASCPPVAFVLLCLLCGAGREGLEVCETRSLTSENGVTVMPSLFSPRHLRLWADCHLPAGWPGAGYFAPFWCRLLLSKKGQQGITS